MLLGDVMVDSLVPPGEDVTLFVVFVPSLPAPGKVLLSVKLVEATVELVISVEALVPLDTTAVVMFNDDVGASVVVFPTIGSLAMAGACVVLGEIVVVFPLTGTAVTTGGCVVLGVCVVLLMTLGTAVEVATVERVFGGSVAGIEDVTVGAIVPGTVVKLVAASAGFVGAKVPVVPFSTGRTASAGLGVAAGTLPLFSSKVPLLGDTIAAGIVDSVGGTDVFDGAIVVFAFGVAGVSGAAVVLTFGVAGVNGAVVEFSKMGDSVDASVVGALLEIFVVVGFSVELLGATVTSCCPCVFASHLRFLSSLRLRFRLARRNSHASLPPVVDD